MNTKSFEIERVCCTADRTRRLRSHARAQRVVHPSRLCRFLERYMQRTAQALQESNPRRDLRCHNRLHRNFAFRVQDGYHCRCLVQVAPNILVALL